MILRLIRDRLLYPTNQKGNMSFIRGKNSPATHYDNKTTHFQILKSFLALPIITSQLFRFSIVKQIRHSGDENSGSYFFDSQGCPRTRVKLLF